MIICVKALGCTNSNNIQISNTLHGTISWYISYYEQNYKSYSEYPNSKHPNSELRQIANGRKFQFGTYFWTFKHRLERSLCTGPVQIWTFINWNSDMYLNTKRLETKLKPAVQNPNLFGIRTLTVCHFKKQSCTVITFLQLATTDVI